MALYKKKRNRRTGRFPLAYLGPADVDYSAQLTWVNRAPTVNDYENWDIGCLWIDTTPVAPIDPNIYMLVRKDAGIATWIQFVSGGSALLTLTGDAGGAVSPSALHNINLLGGNNITTTGTPATNQIVFALTGTTDHTVQLGNATGSLTSLGIGTNNQFLMGTTAADPQWGAITSTGGTIAITTPASNQVNLEVAGSIATTYTTDAGNAVPALGVLNVLGTHGINTTGAGNTVTTAINNAITLGDLAVLAPAVAALTLTSGSLFINGGTGAIATCPTITFGPSNNRIAFPFNDVIIGGAAGNLTATHTGIFNIAIGPQAQQSITSGQQNVGVGNAVLQNCTTGIRNCAYGYITLQNIISGNDNTGIGDQVGWQLTTGSNNLMLGQAAGASLTGADSSNILLEHEGVAGDNNTIRIGVQGGGAGEQNRCFVAGVRGVTTAIADAVPVLIDSAGQLGTVSSSIRYKENIKDIGDESHDIFNLKPVVFNYKSDEKKSKQYGLIAEEVAQYLPKLVVYDPEGNPETIKYQEIPILLLNELKKHHDIIKNLKDRVRILEEQVSMLLQKRGDL